MGNFKIQLAYIQRTLLFRALAHFIENDGVVRAGYIAFAVLFALFPFMIFVSTLASLLGQARAPDEFMELAAYFLPGEVVNTFRPIVNTVLEQRRGGLFTVGLIGTLWAASSGIEAFRYGLNRAYHVTKKRPMWHRRLQGLGFILLGTGIMLAAVLAVITGPILWDLALPILNLSSNMEWVWDVLRYGSAALVLFIAVSLLYRWLPNITQQWRDIIPGALFACSAWLVLATLYSYFLTNVGDFTLVYGSLSGIIVSMLFFFFSALIFIFGAELNAAGRDRRIGHFPGN